MWKGDGEDPQPHSRVWAFIRTHQALFNEGPNYWGSGETVGKVLMRRKLGGARGMARGLWPCSARSRMIGATGGGRN